MPVSPTYPGVYIEEVESGLKPVEIAGTSIAAFLGFTRMGHTMTPVPLENYKAFTEQFGQISRTGDKPYDAMAFAVRAFFQNGGRRAYIVDVANESKPASKSVTTGRTSAPTNLFTVESKVTGALANPHYVYLTPMGDVRQGNFDFVIFEYGSSGRVIFKSCV